MLLISKCDSLNLIAIHAEFLFCFIALMCTPDDTAPVLLRQRSTLRGIMDFRIAVQLNCCSCRFGFITLGWAFSSCIVLFVPLSVH